MKMEVSAMFTKSLPVAILALVLLVVVPGEFATADAPKSVPKLGKAITPEAAAKWDLSVFPDGAGLPPGLCLPKGEWTCSARGVKPAI